MKLPVFISCEHASAAVPPRYRAGFEGRFEVLETHRAYDPGALETARELAEKIGSSPPLEGEFTRLLIDLNRSLGNPEVFSEFSPPADGGLRPELVSFYEEYRRKAESAVRQILEKEGKVVHVSVHSFTPILHGERRNAEFAVLYDPSRPREEDLSQRIGEHFAGLEPDLRVRYNYPYRGNSDGHTHTLRTLLGPNYLGIELELNHRSFFEEPASWSRLERAAVISVSESLVAWANDR